MMTTTYQQPAIGSSHMRYEKLIAANIKHIRAELFYVEHNIGDLSNRFASKKLVQTIQTKLDNVFALSSVTEGYLEEWDSELRRCSLPGQSGYAAESLWNQFRREVARAKHLAAAVKDRPPLASDEPNDEASTVDSFRGNATVDHSFINEAKSEPDWDDRGGQQLYVTEYMQEPDQLTDSLMNKRTEGIRNIKNQIEQARDIFQDLASIVAMQDGGLQQLETNLKDAAKNSEETNYDIESLTFTRLRKSRKRRCLLYGASLVAVSLILYYLHRTVPFL